MAFFRQLQLLLRHRLILRRRQIFILGLEVFWPAIVFFTVLIFRLKFPPESSDTCFYHAKGLPSVGGVNFFQSLICTIDNPCLNETSYSQVPTFQGSKIHGLVESLSPLVTDTSITEIVHNLPSGIQLLTSLVDTLSDNVTDNFVQLFGDERMLKKAGLLRPSVPESIASLRAAATAMPFVMNFINNFSVSLNLHEDMNQLDLKKDGIDLIASFDPSAFGKIMCGQTPRIFIDDFNKLEGPESNSLDEAELASLKSDFCRDGYRHIMKHPSGPVIWAWLKPVLAGKILYAPDNPSTRAIISQMNKTFSGMPVWINALEDWSATLKSLEMFYQQPGIQERLVLAQPLLVKILGDEVQSFFADFTTQQQFTELLNTGGIVKLVQLITNIAQCFEHERFIGLPDEPALEAAARVYTATHELIAGVVFLNVNNTNSSDGSVLLPKKIAYKIRADIDFVPTTKVLKDRIWEPGSRDHYSKHLGYFRGFVQVQEMIDRAITSIHINSSDLTFAPSVSLQQFPYSCYKKDKFGFFILALTPVISTVAWIFLIAFLIRDLVLERELNLEEYLRVTGLKASVAWVTWFLLGFSVMIFGSVCSLTIYKMANLVPHSNMFILYLYFIAFSFSIIMFCYLISCFFRTATIASLSGIVVYLATYLPFMVAITLENEMPYLNKLGSCLSMSTSFCFGIMYLARYEAQGIGIHWSNVWQSPMSEDTMNFASAGLMMIFDGCIYFLIAWYISNVNPPGRNGQRQPWYFFVLPSYWGLVPKRSQSRVLTPKIQAHIHSSGDHKMYSLEKGWHQKAGMSLHNLYVVYNKGSARSEHRAVSNLSLQLKEGQITTLLGRNGAGKTTTISVLTGQIRPTSGSVFVYGHPVPDEFDEARKLLGYCPQYNVLFDNLTIREHLKFFASLKGLLPDDQIEDDIDSMLHSTGLWNMQHELARNLSGGLARRLCVALAFVGGSKLIILDEPTSSVDPVARRSIWDLIVKHKASRTVLLTTHHLDEADILSDQVSVIHRGKLLCSGSPLLLRSKYGCGYQLTVSRQCVRSDEKEFKDEDSGRASCEPPHGHDMLTSDSDRLIAFIKCLIPNATLVEDHSANEVILALPRTGPDGSVHDYATFFRCLDANIHTLGFGSYGLSSTTLEEVFLTLCNSEESGIPIQESNKLALSRKLSNQAQVPKSIPQSDPLMTEAGLSLHLDSSFNGYNMPSAMLVSGFRLKMLQLWALLSKRALHTINDWKSLFCNLALPCIFIALAMGMTCIKPQFAPDPILPIHPAVYGPSTTSFFHLPDVSIGSDDMFDQIVQNLLHSRTRRSFTCPKPRDGWKVAKCPVIRGKPLLPASLTGVITSKDEICKCNSTCPSKSASIVYDTIERPVETEYGFIYNLTSLSELSSQSSKPVEHFLMNTFPSFNDFRYGGFTFHYHEKQVNLNSYPMPTKIEPMVKVWFDNNGYHALAAYLNALDNAILRANLDVHGLPSEEYSITVYSHPFHIRSAQLGDQSLMQRAGDAGIALIILVGFVFIPCSFVFYIVRERTQEEKQLQKFSLFSESSIAFMVIYCIALFIGINTMVMRLLIDVFQLLEVTSYWKETFDSFVLIFPPYALMSGLVDVTKNQLFAEIYTLFGQDAYVNPFSMQMLGKHYIYLASEGAILFFLNLFIEIIANSSFFHWIRSSKSPISSSSTSLSSASSTSSSSVSASSSTSNPRTTTTTTTTITSSTTSSSSTINGQYANEDCDVIEECRRVTQTDGSLFDILRVIEVTKVFKSMFGKRVAVNNVSFGVPRGECFGLLGVNGAGKTTLFKMLTGTLQPTSGKTLVNNKSIAATLASNSSTLGYCPQSDALDMVLTPRQHLMIYARLRGIPHLHRSHLISQSLTKFQLNTHADMPISALSRGTRRKLCLALAMLGNPSLVLLDEPTSGMDPMSRRCLWQNIQDAIKERRSVLLTSHSMEECDILCSRLAIMVNGNFRCIGSPQYLKHKFGTGYTITLRINESYLNWSDAINYMKQSFPSIILRAHHHNMLEFSLPTNDILLSDIFAVLQSAIHRLHLQDFSVTQTTLDQVFVSFANQQVNDFHNSPRLANIQRTESMKLN
uniref:ABC transporter domain-containing protein n=1 Tax=Tetranychus urticae TaxID=32264 RepID=T1KYU1_TETUR